MKSPKFQIPQLDPSDLESPVVKLLLGIIEQQAAVIAQQGDEIQNLKDEIARLKNQKPKPKIRASNLDKKSSGNDDEPKGGKRPGSDKKSKKDIDIHEIVRLKPSSLPPGSIFKGIREFDVQDIRINPHNTRYQIEEWVDGEGKAITVDVPNATSFPHFGGDVVSFILYQHYQCHVTQPLLLEQLEEYGVRISAGQLSRILSDETLLKKFHEEKQDMFHAGLKSAAYLQTDDTCARHAGKNGYATFVGNDFFSWFQSSPSKSRVNFLQILQGGKDAATYLVNDDAFSYMKNEKLAKSSLGALRFSKEKYFGDSESWLTHLESLGIANKRHIRIVSEAALYAAALSKGLSRDLIVLSDDAGQFNIPLLFHALCWVHAERLIQKVIAVHQQGQLDIDQAITDFWALYRMLKAYQVTPSLILRRQIESEFESLFLRTTSSQLLNLALARLYRNREELLLVLDYPELPLHNNMSESDIREYVKRRKVSGGTRSLEGQKARDTFISLKKTCRKLGVSFWSFLKDRISDRGHIAQLSELIVEAAKNRQPQKQILIEA